MSRIVFTHYWVSGFGWEQTIFLAKDFDDISLIGADNDGSDIFIGVNDGVKHIFKGKYV